MPSFALLSLLGVAVAIELTRIHVFMHNDPSYHSVCAISEGVNCETVAVCPYSIFAGLPVSVWGLVGYLLMGGLALWSLSERRIHPTWPLGLLLVLSAFSVATSAVLAFISSSRIDSFCLFCMGSYAINAGLFIVSLIAWRQTRAHAWSLVLSDVKGLVERPVVFAVLALAGAVTLGALLTFTPSCWRTPGWSDLPKLPSGTDLPYADGRFGCVAMMDVLHHLAAPGPVLREMARVVEVGGVLLIADFDDQGFELVSRVHRAEGREHPRTAATVPAAIDELERETFAARLGRTATSKTWPCCRRRQRKGECRQP